LIIIKELLFQLLDELEPNELLQLKFSHNYHTVFVTPRESILPLATEMRRNYNEDTDLVQSYREAYFNNEIDEYEVKFIENHTIHLNDKEFTITEELIDLEYKDDYFMIKIANSEGIYTEYYKYNDIMAIKKVNESSRSYLMEYNALNYKFKTNKN
jgi:hypothetical protein